MKNNPDKPRRVVTASFDHSVIIKLSAGRKDY